MNNNDNVIYIYIYDLILFNICLIGNIYVYTIIINLYIFMYIHNIYIIIIYTYIQ